MHAPPIIQYTYQINLYNLFQQLMQKSEQQLKFKIIIAGDSGVGKSNLRNRFCQGTFDPFSNSTVGIQFSKRHFWAPIQGKTSKLITICFWDAAGKFNQNQLLPSFFKNIVGIIYVYDMSKQQSLQNLKMWKSLITDHINVNKVTQMLIGNKSDLVFLRQVAIYEAEKIKKQLKIPLYFETSALQNINVNQAFYTFISEIMKESASGINSPIKIKKRSTQMRSCF